MTNQNNYLDQRNDFNGPDQGKRGYPKRPQRVVIAENGKKEKREK